MSIERTYGSIKIKSNWFDKSKKNRKILNIKYKGLYLYLTLGKYRLARVQTMQEYSFHVSIDLLRKETGYSTIEIIELLKLLIGQKVIKMKKPTRWDRLYDENRKLKDKEMMIFIAIDVPKIKLEIEEGEKFPKEKPLSDEDFYIPVDLDMLEYYKSVGLNERYFPLFCLLRKLSNGSERKAYMTIQNMAETLGIHHDTIHKYIKVLNIKMLLCSVKKGKKKSLHYEHYLAYSALWYREFLNTNKDTMLKNAKRWEKSTNAEIAVESSDMEVLDVETVEENWNGHIDIYDYVNMFESENIDQAEQIFPYH